MGSAALVGAGLLIGGLYQRSRLRASQSWPRAMGTITNASVAVAKDAESTSYYVAVLYDYVVNGTRYTGKRIGFGKRTYVRKKRAEDELARYPVNSSVIVYFDPQKPADAVLTRDYPDNKLLLVSGIFLLATVAAGLFWQRG